jgi:hypothetical protein
MMGGLRASSIPEELKPAMANQEGAAHPAVPSQSHQRNIDRVLPSLAKDVAREVVGTEESHPGIIRVPQMSGGGDRVQEEDEYDFECDDDNSAKNKVEAEAEETSSGNDDNVVETEAKDDDDDAAYDDDDDDDDAENDDVVDDADDDDRVPTREEYEPVVESVSLKKRKPTDETKEPYLPDFASDTKCGAKSSLSGTLRCKSSALIRHHTAGLMVGASLILAFFCYRRKRQLGGRRSRWLDKSKSHEYARIIQEYDDLQGTFDDDISYNNDDNETMSTWIGGGVGGFEMQNCHSDDRLGIHELNG